MSPSSLVLHGRSLGGYLAKNLSNHADLVVLDKTFWKIGFVARELYNKFAQRFFGLLGGVSTIPNTIELDFLQRDVPLVLMEDPNDEIIFGLSSLGTYLSVHFKDLIFRSSINSGSKIPV